MPDLVIKNAKLFLDGDVLEAELAITDGRISRIAKDIRADDVLDAHGLLVLPGAIDVHVHFRDPGMSHKEDWYSGSCAAAAGGVTTVIDHPNTIPPTTTLKSFEAKLKASRSSIVDFGINAGVVEGAELELLWRAGVTAFGEIYMAESVGRLNIDDDALSNAFQTIAQLNAIACVHAEDERVIKRCTEKLRDKTNPGAYSSSRPNESEAIAIARAVQFANVTSTKLHICHISTREGLRLLRTNVTCEVTPHHLFLAEKDWDKLGTFGKMNPPLRSEGDGQALWAALDRIDMIASDHAPHTEEEKEQDIWSAPAGVPGVETSLPLMLSAAKAGRISLQRLIELMATNPARVFGLNGKGEIKVGNDADLVFVDLNDMKPIKDRNLHSKAGWTPFEGMNAIFPKMTMLRGEVVLDGEIVGEKGSGRFIRGSGFSD
ncbi:MAG: dihydroorotase [Methanosarcinales archaeon Met12]|nr:MAG: dihydroorotase [Methanosarcinales archaeon Met12]